MRSGFYFLLAGILLAAVLLRLPGAFSALWLDEVWTLEIVTGLGSPFPSRLARTCEERRPRL